MYDIKNKLTGDIQMKIKELTSTAMVLIISCMTMLAQQLVMSSLQILTLR
jgi:hypothetical protein